MTVRGLHFSLYLEAGRQVMFCAKHEVDKQNYRGTQYSVLSTPQLGTSVDGVTSSSRAGH